LASSLAKTSGLNSTCLIPHAKVAKSATEKLCGVADFARFACGEPLSGWKAQRAEHRAGISVASLKRLH